MILTALRPETLKRLRRMIRVNAEINGFTTDDLTDRECDKIIESFSEHTMENMARNHMSRDDRKIIVGD